MLVWGRVHPAFCRPKPKKNEAPRSRMLSALLKKHLLDLLIAAPQGLRHPEMASTGSRVSPTASMTQVKRMFTAQSRLLREILVRKPKRTTAKRR